MGEDRNSSRPASALAPYGWFPPWVWVPLSGSAAALVGAAFAIDPAAPWSPELPLVLLASGVTLLGGTVAHLAFAARQLRPSERRADGPASGPVAARPSGALDGAHSDPSSGAIGPARHRGPSTAYAFLDRESNPGEFLWRTWATPETGFPVELAGPVGAAAYSFPGSGTPHLHEEGEPIFIGPAPDLFSRSGGFAVSTEGLGPLDALPSMAPSSLDNDSERDIDPRREFEFSGPGSSQVRSELQGQIWAEAFAKLEGVPITHVAGAHPPEGSRSPRRSVPPSEGSVVGRPGLPLHIPRSARGAPRHAPSPRNAPRTLPARVTEPTPAGETREPPLASPVEAPVTLGDLVARRFREGGLARSSVMAIPAGEGARPPAVSAHAEKRRVRCADCSRLFSHGKGSRRCAACLRRICPECALTAPRTRAGAWCTHCATVRNADTFSSEIDRRVEPVGEWLCRSETDPDFGVLTG